ncbi:MAG: HAMP domain-containing histidine kinase [Lachnospiraceae bacterium]|nr:HAMP domain-containing histidine kinase [Lachnospiraceae bacterium]
MFKKLHIRLTLLCTIVSGSILILMSLACLSFQEANSRESYFSDFRVNVNMLINYLEEQSVISHIWLAQFHNDTHFEIDIQDNGEPLAFGSLTTVSKEEAFARIRETARNEHNIYEETITPQSRLSVHAEFTFTDKQTPCYAAMVLIPKNGGVLNIAILHSMEELQKTLLTQRLLFAAVDTAGTIFLAIFFWLFTWRMILPLIENRRKQTEFIASTSHELRSPLTVMLSSLSAMRQAPPEDAARFSKIIELEGKRMSRLINDMLTLSGADSSSLTLRKTAVELDTLLLSSYEKFESLARDKSISLGITLPEDSVPPCHCDKERMEQALSILLDNALSYTPAGGRVCLSLSVSQENFLMRVADNGPGIPDAEKEAVFDRFYRCDKSHKDKNHFGLGLCIAREIVRMHKGNLWAEDAKGKGTAFVIMLK